MHAAYSLLFIGFISFLGSWWSHEESSIKSYEFIAPPSVTVCQEFEDLDAYRDEKANATFTAITSNGRWDAGSTWNQGGSVPGLNDAVIIPAGITVRLVGVCQSKNLTVDGLLTNMGAMQNFHLQSEWILVKNSGRLRIGTNSVRYTGDGIITLLGTKDSDDIFASGDKFISAIGGGQIDMHGIDRVSWTSLNTNVAAGATLINVKEPIDWPVGSKIVITSSSRNWAEAEERLITNVSANGRNITLDAPLAHKHIGVSKTYTRPSDNKTWTADIRAEVGLLSRNITVQGDAASNSTKFGGHIMVHYNSKAYLNNVELFRMGQESELGRYPFHWHLVKNGGSGQYIKNSSVHRSYNRAITVHGTDYTAVENNVCYDHMGHGIFLEDGGERFNIFKDNLVLSTKRPADGKEVTPSDNQFNQNQNRSPSSFWITNPNNIFEGNVAAGSPGTGYWFIFPVNPVGDSGNDPYYSTQEPWKEPLGSFINNTVHSTGNGMDFFDRLDPDHSIRTNWGWNNATTHLFENSLVYACTNGIYSGLGVGGPVENVIFRNNVFVENKCALFLAAYNHVENGVFVAYSGENMFNGSRFGFHTYDGAARMKQCHFIGFNTNEASLIQPGGAATKHTNTTWENITTDHSGYMSILYPDYASYRSNSPNVWTESLYDVDGSLTGLAGATVVSSHPMMLTGGEFQHSNWQNAYRTTNYFPLAFILYPGIADFEDFPHVTVGRTKAGKPSAGFHHTSGILAKHQMPVIGNDSYLYTYAFYELPTTNMFRFFFDDCLNPGDNTRFNFEKLGLLPGLSIASNLGPLVQHSSHASLYASNSSGYYIHTNGDLFFRPVATGIRQFIDVTWSSPIELPLADSDGDGIGNIYEIAHGRNLNDPKDLAFRFDYDEHKRWNTLNNVSNHVIENGIFEGTATTLDPMIIKDDFNFPANQVTSIIVRMKATANRNVQIFYARNDAQTFAASRVGTTPYQGNGQYKTLIFDFSGDPEWKNNITKLRIDPTNLPGTQFSIDWIIGSDGDVDNDGIPDAQDDCITASSTRSFAGVVPEGHFQTSVSILSNGTVPAGGGTIFESGTVELNQGFEALPNSNFDAKIGCDN